MTWCSGRFSHLKEVCWSDPTFMFQRYKELTRRAGCPVQEPKVLSPFYSPLEGMKDFFLRVSSFRYDPPIMAGSSSQSISEGAQAFVVGQYLLTLLPYLTFGIGMMKCPPVWCPGSPLPQH